MAAATLPLVSTVPFSEALRVWVRVALQSFGGPAGQIAVMHRVLVEEKKWVSEERFLHALNYCMVLPGPEAQQLATYLGWLLHGVRGGVVAGSLFVLPGFLAIGVLSALYVGLGHLPWVGSLFFGLKAAVLVVVVEALLRLAKRALRTRAQVGLAIAAFCAIFWFAVPFPAIVIGAAMVGLWLGRLERTPEDAAPSRDGSRPSTRRTLSIVATCLALWWLPVLGIALAFGHDSVLTQLGVFFGKTAVVTFGGAYAVLAYVGQRAVETCGWLTPGEMLDGLGLAETTPGPLIQVVQFVGFLAAFRNPGALSPWAAGLLGSIIATWVTYVPSFLWILAGAPYIERLRANRSLSHALSGITAAVVGVIANLALWFSLHVFFTRFDERSFGPLRLLVPELGSLDPFALGLAVIAGLALFRWKLGLGWTLVSSAALGILLRALS